MTYDRGAIHQITAELFNHKRQDPPDPTASGPTPPDPYDAELRRLTDDLFGRTREDHQ